jgi:alpha-glucoside transport system permease protein
MERLSLALIVIIGVPAATVLYAYLIEMLLRVFPDTVSRRLRPWFWIAPALALLIFYLFLPAIQTIIIAFQNATTTAFVGLDNFRFAFTDRLMLVAFRNNLIWLFLYTSITLGLALLIAVLADRVRYENAVKAIVFIPMAISYVAAGVIWKLMYEYAPAGRPQIGTVNAIFNSIIPDFEPVAWLINAPINNIALIAIGIWMYTGFATVILSAGLKSIPDELMEASRIDGANEFQIFRHITLPLLSSTIAVVATTMIISVLKIFDVIYVMTNGNFNTEVIAVQMYKQMFVFRHLGRASAIATILLLATIPVMLYNVNRFRSQEELR